MQQRIQTNKNQRNVSMIATDQLTQISQNEQIIKTYQMQSEHRNKSMNQRNLMYDRLRSHSIQSNNRKHSINRS